MKNFQTIQKHLMTLGISASNLSFQKYLFYRRIFIGFLLISLCVVLQFLYIIYGASDFMEYMEAISGSSGSTLVFVGFAAIVFKRTLLFETIDNIDKLIDRRSKCPKSRRFYLKRGQQIERLSEIVFMAVMKILLQLTMLPKCITSFAVYFLTDLGTDSLQLPIPMWFPFDPNNSIGYLIAVILEYILLTYEYIVIASDLALGIGIYCITISVTKEIQHILHSVNAKGRAKNNQLNEVKKLFSECIEAHTAMKQVINDFSEIFQPVFMSLFTWSLLAISGAMLIIQMKIMGHGDIMPLLLLILNGFFGLFMTFTACELGQRISESFVKIELTINKFDWYLFPIEVKRMLPMIIANAQQPVTVECFGSIACTREVFKNINHCAYSYFTVLRKLN